MGKDDETTYSLDELAALSGFDRRVIRSFIEQGLLRGPDSMGRYARYSSSHLLRLMAIRAMRDSQGMQISDIRRALLKLSERDMQDMSAKVTGVQGSCQPLPASSSSALAYLQSIQNINGVPPLEPSTVKELSIKQSQAKHQQFESQEALAKQSGSAPSELQEKSSQEKSPQEKTSLDSLLIELDRLFADKRVRRQAKGEPWFRISITPDVELSIRGGHSEEELARLERIADYLREILLGGLDHE